MKPILDLLSELRPVEWARCVGGSDPLRPPYLAWRFASSDHELAERLEVGVRSHAGETKWIVSKGERNYVLEPEKFAEFAKDFRVDVEAAERFAAAFPGETIAALEDATRLASHLYRTLLGSD